MKPWTPTTSPPPDTQPCEYAVNANAVANKATIIYFIFQKTHFEEFRICQRNYQPALQKPDSDPHPLFRLHTETILRPNGRYIDLPIVQYFWNVGISTRTYEKRTCRACRTNSRKRNTNSFKIQKWRTDIGRRKGNPHSEFGTLEANQRLWIKWFAKLDWNNNYLHKAFCLVFFSLHYPENIPVNKQNRTL